MKLIDRLQRNAGYAIVFGVILFWIFVLCGRAHADKLAQTCHWDKPPALIVWLDIQKRHGFEMPEIPFCTKAYFRHMVIFIDKDTTYNGIVLFANWNSNRATYIALAKYGYRSYALADNDGMGKIIDAEIDLYYLQFQNACYLAMARLLTVSKEDRGWIGLLGASYSCRIRWREIASSGVVLQERCAK